MAIETLEDIAEEMADKLGVYSEDRSDFVCSFKQRVRAAVEVERALDTHWRAAHQQGDTTMTTVDSTSDARTINNVMRHGYRVLSDDEKAQMQSVKDKGLELWTLINSMGDSRELSIAKTKAEEAVMWAVKHLTR